MIEQASGVRATRVTRCDAGKCEQAEDWLAAEEPLEIRAGGQSLGVTLRTPGADEELAAGLLFTEGVISRREQLLNVRVDCDAAKGTGIVEASIEFPSPHAAGSAARRFSAGSACGACGKSSVAALARAGLERPAEGPRFDPEILCDLPEKLRQAQEIFGQTGGLHAAALFDARGDLAAVREDIGRHNAVDKAIGWALLENRLPLSDCALMVSGRGGFEIVQKAIAAGIPLVASVSAPSSLAVELAREWGQTLVGFLRGRRFVIYSGEERIAGPAVSRA
jgi:FdhD protein